MKGENMKDGSIALRSSSRMSDFFRNGSMEERKAVYQRAASEAISEQNGVIRSAKSGEYRTAKCC